MSNEIKRATGLLVIEAVNSNPNGDPDREGDPRQRPNGCGEISPVSFKRKLRDLLDDHDTPFFQALPEMFSNHADRYFILEHRGRDRKQITKELGKSPAIGMRSCLVIHFLKMAAIKVLLKRELCSLEWVFQLRLSIFCARQIPIKQVFRRGKMPEWHHWAIAS